MIKSDEIKQLATALLEVQKNLPALKKTADNPFYKSKYSPLDEILPKALAVLSTNGIALVQTVGTAETGDTTLTTTLLHTSGEWLSDTQPLLLAKADPQGQGSAITYARRYALMSMLGLVAEGEDDDANIASGVVHGESGLRIEHSSAFKDIEARIKATTDFASLSELSDEIRKTPMSYSEKKDLNAAVVRQGGKIKSE